MDWGGSGTGVAGAGEPAAGGDGEGARGEVLGAVLEVGLGEGVGEASGTVPPLLGGVPAGPCWKGLTHPAAHRVRHPAHSSWTLPATVPPCTRSSWVMEAACMQGNDPSEEEGLRRAGSTICLPFLTSAISSLHCGWQAVPAVAPLTL